MIEGQHIVHIVMWETDVRERSYIRETLIQPADAFAVLVCKRSASLPFVHLRQSVCTRRFFTVSLELFNNLVFVVSIFPVAIECLEPVLATIFVDTLSARVVALERTLHHIIEPRTSQSTLNKFPYLSRTSGDLSMFSSIKL